MVRTFFYTTAHLKNNEQSMQHKIYPNSEQFLQSVQLLSDTVMLFISANKSSDDSEYNTESLQTV